MGVELADAAMGVTPEMRDAAALAAEALGEEG